jgi:phenylacetate-CoA ligase
LSRNSPIPSPIAQHGHSAQRWHSLAEPKILAAFINAATRVPAYKNFLAQRGVDPTTIRTLDDFAARVPVIDKDQTFGAHDLPDLCQSGTIAGATAAYTSSGYSGTFSFGLETPDEAERLRQRVDLMLGGHFGAPARSTLLINALPMGVRVPASAALVIDTGTRTDAVLACVRKLGPSLAQIVIIAEHPLLKKIIEDGADSGIDWPSRCVHLVTGAEVMPESFRDYAGKLLGHTGDESRGKIVVSLGISEVGLSIAQETPWCRHVRKMAQSDPQLRREIFGHGAFTPTLAQWSPEDFWLETIAADDGRERLAVTTLDTRRKIPLIRYATGDWARVIDADEIASRAGEPELPLPCIAMWGRGRSLRIGNQDIYPEQVKESLYSNPAVAGATTGNFKLSLDASTGTSVARVLLQLKSRHDLSSPLADAFAQELTVQFGVVARVAPIAYDSFPDAAAESYQRKFRYLD